MNPKSSSLLDTPATPSTAAGQPTSTPAPAPVPSPTPAPTPTPTPAAPPPQAASEYNQIQQATGWLTCGACGNTGGGGLLATYEMTRGITLPSLSGSSAQFSIGGNYPYADAYWYYRHTSRDTQIDSLRYEFDLFIPAGDENAPQAIEFECQQRLNGFVYNFAWQAEYPSNHWRVFNYTAKKWEQTAIALQRFTPNTWHHIVAEYHNNTTTHKTFHDALTIDGVRYPLSIVHDATSTGNQTSEFTNAFQLDLNGKPVPYSVYVDNMKVTMN